MPPPQKTKVEYQGSRLAEISGLVEYVKLKKSRGRGMDLTIITMVDGFQITSWHTSTRSRQLCEKARGRQVTAVAKVTSFNQQRYFNLDHFQTIGEEPID